MSETSLHHYVSDIATLWNKGELHFYSVIKDPIIVVQKKKKYLH